MNYFDADGEPLGNWEPTTSGTYWEIVGPDHAGLTVYASHTEVGVRMETDWGLEGGETPVARTVFLDCDYGKPCSGEHRYYRWVAAWRCQVCGGTACAGACERTETMAAADCDHEEHR